MRINCPCCGARPVAEFTYGGAALERPDVAAPFGSAEAPAQSWSDYVYRRDNPLGPNRERWFHAAGCRQWFVVTRDTRNNDFLQEVNP
ncbi:sarcosine oxidase subunit delta [Rhizobium sp. CG5]|uniref:sarcosine oxidase subunit delta n=1 Tax=Rhizobium sp. CG5 TaxID=2726076 RepID=UPI0020331CAB|nr:sarcosine oxidase subunit delta [Rhizobium sp. CG5]MCM2477377.1 sarcosine oxidase subunit delta [Rhizobium sp. CG5]